MSVGSSAGGDFPLLSDEQIASVARRGMRHETSDAEVLYQAGERGYDFVVIEFRALVVDPDRDYQPQPKT